MNRTQQLKLLDDEVRRLFSEGTTESNAYDQLHADPRFDTVRRVSIQSLFKKLQKDADKQAKTNKLSEQKRYRQNAENLLLCESQSIVEEYEIFIGILEERYYLTSSWNLDNVHTVKMFDLYQGISKDIPFPVDDDSTYLYIWALTGKFGLMFKITEYGVYSVYLIRIDLIEGKLELVQTVKSGRRPMNVFFDSLDRSKFVLAFIGQRFSVIECNVSGGKVNVGEEILLLEEYNPVFVFLSYFNNKLIGLKFDDGHRDDFNHASIVVQELDGAKESKTLKLEPLPSNVNVQRTYLRSPYVWICDHLFVPVRFVSTEFCGIAFTDLQTCKWSILEFTINLPITNMTRGDNCALMIHAGKLEKDYDFDCDEVSAVYKLPIRKPESLRYKAWLMTISWFKKQGVADPYKQARRFLPFNSEVHTPFNVDEHENDGQE